jgi:trypsin-like peptidase
MAMNGKIGLDAARAVVAVGKGRGFVVETQDDRVVITAAHCLPKFPPRASISHTEERTYPKLLGKVGGRRSVCAECIFLDPVADIAVLASPDDQELAAKADEYNELTKAATLSRVSELKTETVSAWVFPLKGPPFQCVVQASRRGLLWIEKAKIVPGMSGSPILAEDGSAIGVVVTPNGPNPSLASHLPGWLLAELGLEPT